MIAWNMPYIDLLFIYSNITWSYWHHLQLGKHFSSSRRIGICITATNVSLFLNMIPIIYEMSFEWRESHNSKLYAKFEVVILRRGKVI